MSDNTHAEPLSDHQTSVGHMTSPATTMQHTIQFSNSAVISEDTEALKCTSE